jgi:magnesium-protoporphyrin O-methyltransferase
VQIPLHGVQVRSMTCAQCVGVQRFFDAKVARRELRRYRRRGPAKTTRMLVDALAEEGVAGASFLDIGGGIGAVQHALAAAGAAGGTSVDASQPYLEAARDEAALRGYAERVRYVSGDFLDVQDEVGPADLVALDRVVCCYPDMAGLVEASARRARRAYGLVYPRDRRFVKAAIWTLNLFQRLRRHPFRVFVHATEDVEARVAAQGLSKARHARTFFWQVVVFTRPPTASGTHPTP